MRKIGQDHARL